MIKVNKICQNYLNQNKIAILRHEWCDPTVIFIDFKATRKLNVTVSFPYNGTLNNSYFINFLVPK